MRWLAVTWTSGCSVRKAIKAGLPKRNESRHITHTTLNVGAPENALQCCSLLPLLHSARRCHVEILWIPDCEA